MSNLTNTLNQDEESFVGIGHTRWATHGKPSQINSHPHLDNSNCFSVVHNGIIENYAEIKSFLTTLGYTFYSATDTEVIPNLIHYNFEKYLKENNINIETQTTENLKDIILKVIHETCKKLHGSYALEIISTYLPNSLVVTRKDSPLVIGQGENESYISSDIPAILSFTKDFYLLNNFESAYLTKESLEFYDKDLIIGLLVDSDADGYTSSSILYRFLTEEIEHPVENIRIFLQEGKQHGLNSKVFKEMLEELEGE